MAQNYTFFSLDEQKRLLSEQLKAFDSSVCTLVCWHVCVLACVCFMLTCVCGVCVCCMLTCVCWCVWYVDVCVCVCCLLVCVVYVGGCCMLTCV